MKKRAMIVVIEGTDGSGKRTQSEMLNNYLKKTGAKIKLFSFPDYNLPTGKIIGGPLLGRTDICSSYFKEDVDKIDPIVSSLLYAADRRYAFLKSIETEIYKNDVIILDRYTTSNLGHQASKATSKSLQTKIQNIVEFLEYDLCELPKPDLVIFINMPYEVSKLLREDRKVKDNAEKSDRHIKNASKTYVRLSKRKKWSYVSCMKKKNSKKVEDIKSIEEIHYEIIDIFNKNYKTKRKKITKITRYK